MNTHISAVAKSGRPDPQQVKLNVDGSFYAKNIVGSVGAVMRDHNGNFIAASTLVLPNISSAAATEVIAIREGLSLAVPVGCNNIVAESDSVKTIEGCMGVTRWWNKSSVSYADCVHLATLVGTVSFKHCLREANEVADELARVYFFDNNSCNWVDELLVLL
jgi:ribonuclease HI